MTGFLLVVLGLTIDGFIITVFILVDVYLTERAHRRVRARRREDEHHAGIVAYQPGRAPVLVRVVNGRPVMPPRLPVPVAVRWTAPTRWMAWTEAGR